MRTQNPKPRTLPCPTAFPPLGPYEVTRSSLIFDPKSGRLNAPQPDVRHLTHACKEMALLMHVGEGFTHACKEMA